MTTTRMEPATSGLMTAVGYLRAGELVAFPTETVYGLGADARRDDAVRKIYAAKGRPATNPTIVHAADVVQARHCVRNFPELAEKLAARFWPGPLTLILERGPGLSELVSGGRSTVAVRVPRHPVAEALLQTFDGPIAAPSANRSGFVSPTTAEHVLAELAGRVPMILDGGPCQIGVESTVLDLTQVPPVIMRPGGITAEMIEPVIGQVRLFTGSVSEAHGASSPGTFSRHYAPRARAYRFTPDQWPQAVAMADAQGPVALISHDEHVRLPAPHETILMSRDPGAYAQALYAAMHQADARKPRAILLLMPPDRTGLWAAVADRLQRAAVPLPM